MTPTTEWRPGQPTGWIHDPGAIEDLLFALQSQHLPATYSAATESVAEDARGEKIFCADWEAELKIFGNKLDPWRQTIGSCVGYATGRAAQALILDRLATRGGEMWRAQVSPGAIYAGSRVNVGKGRLGYSDGSIVAWAAEWVTRCLLLQIQYHEANLTADPGDQLAAAWGRPGKGVPEALIPIGKHLAVTGTTQIDTPEALCDALWRRHWVTGGCNIIHSDTRDKWGQCRPEGRSGHAQNRCGIYLDQDGDTAILLRQSWGSQTPGGPSQIKLVDKTTRDLPAGVYGVKLEHEARAVQSGDFWALCGTGGWTPDKADWSTAI